MCLIVHRHTKGKRGQGANVPDNILDANSYANPDGFGVAWREASGELSYRKFGPGRSNFESFRDLVKGLDKEKRTEYVAHFRLATHGKPCEDLSHPFEYTDPVYGRVLVFHNGVLDAPRNLPDTESDTSYFVKRVLAAIEPGWWQKPVYRYLIEEAIGASRLLVMTSDGTYRFNQSRWVKRQGIWYSTTPTTKKVSYYSFEDDDYGWRMPPVYGMSGKSAIASARSFGLTDDDEADEEEREEEALLTAAPTTYNHMGHKVKVEDDDYDPNTNVRYGLVSCQTCKQEGDFYVIDGKTYIDVRHVVALGSGLVVPANHASVALVPAK